MHSCHCFINVAVLKLPVSLVGAVLTRELADFIVVAVLARELADCSCCSGQGTG